MAATVSEPDANLVPLHPPLAVQLEATGEVDHVSRGVTLPVPDVGLAVKVMVPAAWAFEAVAQRIRGSARSA